jgi:hypothetical protein
MHRARPSAGRRHTAILEDLEPVLTVSRTAL